MFGNKTILITGGSRGIGRAIARFFAIEGYNVAITCKSSESELKETEKELKDYGVSVLSYLADVSDYEEMKKVVADIENRFGRIDVLVNNAGVAHIGLFNTMKIEQWKKVVDVNFFGVLNTSHLVLQNMVRLHKGNIINISSMWGEMGASCEAVYSATKGAINSFTKSLAKELAPNHIRVNAISCGVIETEMNDCFTPSEKNALMEEIPLGRFGRAEEVAKLAYYLASEDSAYITGQILNIDGGMS